MKPSTTGTATGVRAPAASATSAQFQRAKDTIQQNAMNREMNQLQRQRQQAQVDLDVDTINRLDRRMKEIRAAQGRQTVGDRASDTLSGAVQSYGAGVVNAVGTVANSMNDPAYYRRQIASLQKRLEAGGYSDGRQFVRDNETVRQKLRDSMREMADKAWQLERPTSFVNRTYQLADRMQDDSAQSIASAKEGAGKLGQLAVDVGMAGTQMGLDALASALIPGGGKAMMAARSFGSTAKAARQAGASLERQLLAATGAAGISVASEGLTNFAKPFQKIYGKGAAETIAGRLAGRFGENAAVQGALKSPLPTAVYLLYRNSSDRDGNGSTSAAESTQTLMELEGLTDKQKGEAWSAFNNRGETEESRERKEAKNPFTGVLAGDYSPEEVMAAWGIFDGKGTKEEPYTKERKKKDLQEEFGISLQEANDLYTLMKRAAEQ